MKYSWRTINKLKFHMQKELISIIYQKNEYLYEAKDIANIRKVIFVDLTTQTNNSNDNRYDNKKKLRNYII